MSYQGDGGNYLIMPILAGVVSTSETAGYVRIGSFSISLDSLASKGLVVVLSAVVETTNAASHYQLRLWNVTGAAVVGADPLIDGNSLTPIGIGETVTMPSGENNYEVQMKMSAGVAPDKVTCSACYLVILWNDF